MTHQTTTANAVPELSQTPGTPPLSQSVPTTLGTPPDLRKHTHTSTVPANAPGTPPHHHVSAGQRVSQPVPPTGEVGLRHHTRLHLPTEGAAR